MHRDSSEIKTGTQVQWVYTNSDKEIVQRKVVIVVPRKEAEGLERRWVKVLLTEGYTEIFPTNHPNFKILSEVPHDGS